MNDTQDEAAAIVEAQAQRLFASAVDRNRLDSADGAPLDRDLWGEVVRMGLPLALLAEDHGGIGLEPRHALRLIHLAASHALPLPLGETMMVAALAGTPMEEPATLAVAGADGRLLRVPYGDSAAQILIVDAAAESWGRPDFVLRAALVKSRAGLASGRVAAIVHQVHAAMGFTREHTLHFFTRRLWSWREEFGADAAWDEWLGRKVCAAGGGTLWSQIVAATSSTPAAVEGAGL